MPNPETISPVTENGAGADPSSVCLWRVIDQIHCISLSTRPDRRQTAQREFERVGLAGLVQFMTVDRHPTDSEQGIFESHMKCLRAGLDAGAKRILIFEDDIIFHRYSLKTQQRIVNFINTDPDWQIFFLGCFVRSTRKTAYPSVLRARYRCNAHAYIVNRPYAEKLVTLPWSGIAIDDLLAAKQDGHFYTCYPSFAYQNGSSSDNDKTIWIDRIRRNTGGIRRFQRWNEFSRRNATALIAIHAAIILLLIAVVLLHELKKF